jgi:hypothetical protein
MTLYFLDRRYPFLPREDLRQTCRLAELLAGADHVSRRRRAYVEAERLAHDLGWRKIVVDHGVRRWVPEAIWLASVCRGERRRPGAPPGNRNAAGHAGRNQQTRERERRSGNGRVKLTPG